MAEAAAAVSLITSIASLIDLAVKVASRLHEFASKTADVPESFRALSQRLPLLSSTLQLITRQAQVGRLPDDVTAALQTLVQSTSAHVAVLDACLAKIAPTTDASRVRRAVKALQSLTKDGEIRLAVERIHQDIDFLVLHQTTQHVDTGDQILDALATLQLGLSQAPLPTPRHGHIFPAVSAHDHSNVHLGDVYSTIQDPRPGKPQALGLCLASAPLIDTKNFIGRAAELNRMTQVLRPDEPAVEQRRLMLGGMGGIGKTQLAIAYARRYQTSYASVFWLNAKTELTLKASFRSIAQQLLSESELKSFDDEGVVREVSRWLSDVQNPRWLLIFDNYDDPDLFVIGDYIPNTAHGSVIITTRLPDLISGRQMEEVRVLPISNLDESLEILQTRSQRENVKQGEYGRICHRRISYR
jgi:hypothetical protein